MKRLNNLDLYCRRILDTIPMIVFVVDEDGRILDLNRAAKSVFGVNKATVLKRRGGEVLHCLHSYDVPEGCGRAPFCKDCIIRNSVKASMKGKAITRRRTKVELLLEGTKKELELLITTSPMPADDTVLLIIEDISEFTQLKDIIPICVKCRRIRDDKDYWRSVESYFKDYVGVDFSHGICSECLHEFYPNFHIKSKERQSKRLKNQDVVC